MSGERILVIGPSVRAGLIGAMLAKRWLGAGRELVIAVVPDGDADRRIAGRPELHRFHTDLGISAEALVKHAGAVPIFAIAADSPSGPVDLPFSPFGVARSGVDFLHYWKRSADVVEQPDLADFSLGLVLHKSARNLDLSKLERAQLPFGLELGRGRYGAFLLQIAQQDGAQILNANDDLPHADLTVDCRLEVGEPRWESERLKVSSECAIPGLECQLAANAARRLVGLSANFTRNLPERREYSRLASLEAERISDMLELIQAEDPASTTRPALKRKIDLFAACGRIPTEDFEVFSQPEWLAALWGRGLRPKRIDRMAKALPEVELLAWMSQLRGQIAQISESAGAV